MLVDSILSIGPLTIEDIKHVSGYKTVFLFEVKGLRSTVKKLILPSK